MTKETHVSSQRKRKKSRWVYKVLGNFAYFHVIEIKNKRMIRGIGRLKMVAHNKHERNDNGN
jgi:hypothetical protein